MKTFSVPRCFFVAVLVALPLLWAQAQNTFCVRAGAAGANNGSDWNNAYASLPATLMRGATYYVADGSYSEYTFDDAESGTSIITIKKATASDHGTNTGWSSAYGDGQASFNGGLIFARDYYVIDGQTRNEQDWTVSSSYGFRAISVTSNSDSFPPGGDNITIEYVDVGLPYTENYQSGMDRGISVVSFSTPTRNITISRCFVHNCIVPIFLVGAEFVTVEHCQLGPGWGKEGIRGSYVSRNNIIRNNVFRNSSQLDPQDPTSGCTADVGVWSDETPGSYDNWEIYGNLIYNTKSIHHTDAVVFIGGNGANWVGAGANNCKVYNNTIAGIDGQVRIALNGNNNRAFNNLFYNNQTSGSVTATATGNNLVATVNPFVSLSGDDYRLLAGSGLINQGSNQGSPFNVDRYGTVRGADGAWDVGAYEFAASGIVEAPTPTPTPAPIPFPTPAPFPTQTPTPVPTQTSGEIAVGARPARRLARVFPKRGRSVCDRFRRLQRRLRE